MRKGFSFFEISIVLGIVISILLLSLPQLNTYQKNIKLSNEARILATDLRLAQQLAITEQVIYRLKMSAETNRYQIINSQTLAVYKEHDVDPEIEFLEISGFTDETVEFTSTGAPIKTGTITLQNSKLKNAILEIKPSGYATISE